MAYTVSGRNAAATHISLFTRLAQIFASFSEAIELHREFRRTHRELSELSDRELNDLGISRAMLVQVAWTSAVEKADERKPR
ncbi:MAG: DUF1127 domain-containing protein [Pseudomonadota bacterium]